MPRSLYALGRIAAKRRDHNRATLTRSLEALAETLEAPRLATRSQLIESAKSASRGKRPLRSRKFAGVQASSSVLDAPAPSGRNTNRKSASIGNGFGR